MFLIPQLWSSQNFLLFLNPSANHSSLIGSGDHPQYSALSRQEISKHDGIRATQVPCMAHSHGSRLIRIMADTAARGRLVDLSNNATDMLDTG